MPVEIERKYLVLANELPVLKQGQQLIQAYLWNEPDKSIRIRLAGKKAFLTIKTGKNPLERSEFEYEIPTADAQELLLLCTSRIEKTRYRIPHKTHVWELDVFEGNNKGLLLAEIELSDANQSIDLPRWVTEEVTNDPRYLNAELIKHPFVEW